MKPKILTKFSTFHDGLFNDDAGIKISLPVEFNDPFDAQLRFSDQEINSLVDEFNSLPDTNINKWSGISNANSIELHKIPARKATTADAIKYYIQRLQTTHILCLNSISALDFNTSHMWGIYANNGKGVALEFDYTEIENRFNYASLKSFLSGFYNAGDKDEFISNYLNDDLFHYIKEIIKRNKQVDNSPDNPYEEKFLSSDLDAVKVSQSDFLKDILTTEVFTSFLPLTNNLIPLTYNSRFDTLIDIFKNYLFLILSGNFYNPIGYNLVNSFFSNKHNIWQNEHEYRLLIPNFALVSINEIEKRNGFYEKKANFRKAIGGLESYAKSLVDKSNIKTLKFTNKFQLSSYNYQSNELKRPILFSDTLPFPAKIYLGWDFKIYECETCRIETKEFLAIQDFRNRIRESYGIAIELYKLKKEVDYSNNTFISELVST